MENKNKTQEQVRGSILEKRLKTLNEFLFKYAGTDVSFGAYLKEIGINEDKFLSELPEDLIFKGISDETSDSQRLVDYGRALNLVYHLQHLKHINNTDDFSSLDVSGAPEYRLDGVITYDNYGQDFLNSVGSWFKKTIDNVKNETKKVVEKVKKSTKKSSGSTKKPAEKRHVLRKVLHGVNKFNPLTAVPRNAFLSLMSINATALANAFNHIENDRDKTEWNKILKTWDTLGGDKSALVKAIDNGSKKKPFPGIKKKKHGADGYEAAGGDDSIDVTNPANAGKVAAGSAAGLTGLAGILATNPVTAPSAVYVASGAAVLGAVSPILKKYAQRKGEGVSDIESPSISGLDPDTMGALRSIQDGTDDDDVVSDIGEFLNKNKWWFVGGLTVIVGGAIMLFGGENKK